MRAKRRKRVQRRRVDLGRELIWGKSADGLDPELLGVGERSGLWVRE